MPFTEEKGSANVCDYTESADNIILVDRHHEEKDAAGRQSRTRNIGLVLLVIIVPILILAATAGLIPFYLIPHHATEDKVPSTTEHSLEFNGSLNLLRIRTEQAIRTSHPTTKTNTVDVTAKATAATTTPQSLESPSHDAVDYTQMEVVVVTEPGMFQESSFFFLDLGGPFGLTTTADGLVVVCEPFSNLVHILTETLQPVTVFNFTGEMPCDVAELDGLLYISGTTSNDIHVFHKNGTFMRKIGSNGTLPGQFVYPTGITAAGGNLYICDSGNDRIQVRLQNGTWIVIGHLNMTDSLDFIAVSHDLTRIAVTASQQIHIFNKSYDLDHIVNVTSEQADFEIWGVAFDPHGTLIVCDNSNSITIMDHNYDVVASIDSPVGRNQSLAPFDVAVTQAGDVIVSDVQNNYVALLKVPHLKHQP